jgi:hypothetical protein
MQARFLEPDQILSEIFNFCQNNKKLVNHLQSSMSFIHYQNMDFIRLIELFHTIVKDDYINDALVISLGESPSKMVELQTKMKLWRKKNCQVFFMPVSKTVLHLNIKLFYADMEDFYGENWEDFFDHYLQQNLNAPHVDRYIDFLRKRGILQEFVEKLKNSKKIIFVDFLMYGNSFVGYFLYLFVPLLYKLGFSIDTYTLETVFLIDPENTHHQIADALRFLLESYFVRQKLYFLEDILSKQNAQTLTNFFMDNKTRIIQQVKANNYHYPDQFPLKKNYIPLLLFMYMMIILNKQLLTYFVFF